MGLDDGIENRESHPALTLHAVAGYLRRASYTENPMALLAAVVLSARPGGTVARWWRATGLRRAVDGTVRIGAVFV